MPVLTAATVLIGALTLLNLLLTTAVIRRLREREDQSRSALPRHLEGLAGRAIPEFSAATAAGVPVTREELLGGQYLVGFFSAGCVPCHEQAPALAALAGVETVIAVVAGDGPGADDLIQVLEGVPVVVGVFGDAMASAAGITAFPTFVRVDGAGTISAVLPALPQRRPTTAAVVAAA